ncbi:MAG: sigma-54-dependent Fis family transcriptional regulator, partial [Desulfobacterales bacterium]|nr:sigma-54-dependent Fis family transcriptional regulator [Desulfobacterales bacterium]
CAAISMNLVESELFGHEKGAFTGADRQKKGKFEYAAGGTLFLDEIGDLPENAQAKLLRTLEEKVVQRVGGNSQIPVDARIICATNRDLAKLVERGEFRQDLYYRINVLPVRIPPLRERIEDVVPIANYALKQLGEGKPIKLSEGASRLLKSYNWPGNVRELVNAMERALILEKGQGVVTAEALSFIRKCGDNQEAPDNFELPPSGVNLEAIEADMVRQALELTNHNQTAAAKLLGLTRAKFRVLMKQIEK